MDSHAVSQPIPRNQIASPSLGAKRKRLPLKVWLSPLALAGILILLVVIGRDVTVKTDFEQGINQLSRQIISFKQTHNRLPNQNEFLAFQVKSRNLLLDKIQYDYHFTLADSPEDTVLAYSPLPPLWILKQRHLVLYLNGDVAWKSPETLLQDVRKRDQFYYSRTLTPNSTLPSE